jgi:hypothetical protein
MTQQEQIKEIAKAIGHTKRCIFRKELMLADMAPSDSEYLNVLDELEELYTTKALLTKSMEAL